MPSFRATNFKTMSHDHVSEPSEIYSSFRSNVGGIKPGYMGWVPKTSTLYGQIHSEDSMAMEQARTRTGGR